MCVGGGAVRIQMRETRSEDSQTNTTAKGQTYRSTPLGPPEGPILSKALHLGSEFRKDQNNLSRAGDRSEFTSHFDPVSEA